MVCNKDNIIIISPKLLMRGPIYGCNELTKDDWLACDKGRDLARFDFDNVLLWDNLKGSELELYNDEERIARCRIKNGQIAVVYEDDVYHYNPYFKRWHETHPYDAIHIPNYDGIIYIEDNKLIAKGNIYFEGYAE